MSVLTESSAVLTKCHGFSRRSGFIAVDGSATLTMKSDFTFPAKQYSYLRH